MAKALNLSTAAEGVASSITATLAGIGGGFDPSRYKIRSGLEIAAEPRSFNLLLYGDLGTGKTYVLVELLRLGFKVVLIITDYGKTGSNTIYSYFADHPDERHLLGNLREVVLDYAGLNAFSRNPTAFPGFEDLYTWDPDFIFWDGISAYQEIEAEKELTGSELNDNRENDWAAWRKTRNATVYPMDRILAMGNRETGRKWGKVFTALEKVDGEYETVIGRDGKPERIMISGTKKVGPLLHTSARKIAAAGFDLVMHTLKETTIGGKESFWYETTGGGLVVKGRGYELPTKIKADFVDIWKKYIGPRVGAYGVVESITSPVTSPSPSPST